MRTEDGPPRTRPGRVFSLTARPPRLRLDDDRLSVIERDAVPVYDVPSDKDVPVEYDSSGWDGRKLTNRNVAEVWRVVNSVPSAKFQVDRPAGANPAGMRS
jgi:hypothetical protein